MRIFRHARLNFMKIIIPLIFTFLLFSCRNTDEKSENQIKIDKLQAKVDSLEKKFQIFDTQTHELYELLHCINKIKNLAYLWVENQSSSESKEKLELIQRENECIDILTKMKESEDFRSLKPGIKKISQELDEVLKLVNEIKIILPSFESYQDPYNVFFSQKMIAQNSELDMMINDLLLKIIRFKDYSHKAKNNVQREIDKLKIEIKKLSAEE